MRNCFRSVEAGARRHAAAFIACGIACSYGARNAAASAATLRTPHDVPVLSLAEDGPSATVEGGTEDQLFFLRVSYRTFVSLGEAGGYEETFTAYYAPRAERTATGFAATFDWKADVDSLYTRGAAAVVTLRGVDAGLAHPSTPSYEEGLAYADLFRPGVPPSNVENGYGLVAGIAEDTASVTIRPARLRPSVRVPR